MTTLPLKGNQGRCGARRPGAFPTGSFRVSPWSPDPDHIPNIAWPLDCFDHFINDEASNTIAVAFYLTATTSLLTP